MMFSEELFVGSFIIFYFNCRFNISIFTWFRPTSHCIAVEIKDQCRWGCLKVEKFVFSFDCSGG